VAADRDEEYEGADTREQHRHVGIEAHQDRREHGRPEHGDDMLKADDDGLTNRQPLLGKNHSPGFQLPAEQSIRGIRHGLPPACRTGFHLILGRKKIRDPSSVGFRLSCLPSPSAMLISAIKVLIEKHDHLDHLVHLRTDLLYHYTAAHWYRQR
jgi:hypothetical protein